MILMIRWNRGLGVAEWSKAPWRHGATNRRSRGFESLPLARFLSYTPFAGLPQAGTGQILGHLARRVLEQGDVLLRQRSGDRDGARAGWGVGGWRRAGFLEEPLERET